MAKTVFKATAEDQDGLTMLCKVRGFEVLLDEPVELGGNDKGMNPVEALLTALAACKAIVVKAFVARKRIKLNSVRIEVEGVLDPDGFMGTNRDAKIGFSEIMTHYYIDADNTQEEIAQYVEFVESNCPVNDSIVNAPVMTHDIHNV
ncbi:MAG: OsmC family protein [Eubacteriales bacterium]|nr:OsmC family protein [Eubacteriales bacterium]